MWFKSKYRLKKYGSILLRDTFSPIFNEHSFFQFLTIPIFLLLSASVGDLNTDVWGLSKSLFAAVITIPVWVIINIPLCIFRMLNEEKKEGYWLEERFIFHYPKLVKTLVIDQQKNQQTVRIAVNVAPAQSFVQFRTEYDGGLGFIEITTHEKNTTFLGISRETLYGSRISNNKQIVVRMHSSNGSDKSICRIFALYFEK